MSFIEFGICDRSTLSLPDQYDVLAQRFADRGWATLSKLNSDAQRNAQGRPTHVPQTSVAHLEDKDVITIEVPGAFRIGLNIEVAEDRVMCVSYKPQPDDVPQPPPFSMSFSRGHSLASDCDFENVSTDHRRGILTIKVPKAVKAKPRRIEIE
jgi:HSP20 family molecular chaperone IbpA